MGKQDYNDYSNIGLTRLPICRVPNVLDTEAGPNFIEQYELDTTAPQRYKTGPLLDICDAYGKLQDMLGSVRVRA